MDNETEVAVNAIYAMAKENPEYCKLILENIVSGEDGGKTDISNSHLLAYKMINSEWERVEGGSRGKIHFKTDIPGYVGVAPIKPWDNLILTMPDSFGYSYAEFVRAQTEEERVEHMTLVCEYVDGELRAQTLHVGDPILPSTTLARDSGGRRITGEDALALGLTLGKFAST